MTARRVVIGCDGPRRPGGEHPPRSLETFLDDGDGWGGLLHEAVSPPVGKHARGEVERTRRGWRFVCPRCGLDVRLADRVLTAVLDRTAATGVERVGLAELELIVRNPSAIR
jgi:hypothetical protein